MTSDNPFGQSANRPSLQLREQYIERFEQAWLAGQRPALTAYLPAEADGRRMVLVELVHADLEFRLKAGEPARVETYLRDYPELAVDSETVLGLIAAEYDLRRRWEPELARTEYLERFPALGPQLKIWLDTQACLTTRKKPPPERGSTVNNGSGTCDPLDDAARLRLQVPGYEILGELGRGGMGVVYQARQSRLGRLVALKMILAGSHADEEERARFQAEAEAIARLQHANIVQVHEVGEYEGKPFFSLEYCGGGSLEKQLRGTPLPAHTAAALAETLACAIQAAHDKGIVHRDLKPANVLLTEEGVPKVTDFGLAKRLGETGQTQSGAIMGTASYMAPEQAAGQSKEIGPAADVYALGAMLYECLTGRPPFRAATTAETIWQVLRDEPVPPSRLQSRTPRDLETICLKCLQKEPHRRYATARELAEDLRRFQQGQPVRARPVAVWERGWRWCRRNPVLAGAAVLVILAVTTAFVLVTASRSEALQLADEKARLAQEMKDLANKMETLALTETAQRRRIQESLAESYLDQALALCDRGESGAGLLWLARSLGELPDRRSPLAYEVTSNLAAWAYETHPLQAILKHDNLIVATAFSPDSRIVATGGVDGTARLWRVPTGEPLGPALRHGAMVWTVAFSPDGNTVLTAGDRRVRLWDVASGEPRGTLEHPAQSLIAAFDPQGRTIVTGSDDGSARLWHAVTGKLLRSLTGHRGAISQVGFSRDGNTVFTAGADNTIRRWDAMMGTPLGQPLEPPRPLKEFLLSPDGRLLLTISTAAAPRLYDARTGQPVAPPLRCEMAAAAAWGPGSQLLVTCDYHQMVRLWSTQTGKLPALFPSGQRSLLTTAFSPDAWIILAGGEDGAVRLWESATGRPFGPSLYHPTPVVAATFSPDGRTILTRTSGGQVRLWARARSKLGRFPFLHAAPIKAATFSRDGRNALTVSGDQLTLWDTKENKLRRRLWLSHGPFDKASFSRDGKRLLTTGPDHVVRLWDTGTGKPLGGSAPQPNRINLLVFSDDGRTALVADQKDAAQLLDVQAGRPLGLRLRHQGTITAAAFSPDGRLVVTGSSDKTARLWDVQTGSPRGRPLTHPSFVASVAFRPDGRVVATACYDSMARLWDMATGQPIGAPLAHRGPVNKVVFSPDSQTVATASLDRTARLWHATTGEPLGLPLPHSSQINEVHFSSDNRLVATLSFDEGARLWLVPTGRALGPALKHRRPVSWFAFRPDGRMVLTASEDRSLRLWPLRDPLDIDRGKAPQWLAAVLGMTLDKAGGVRYLREEQWRESRRLWEQEPGVAKAKRRD